MLTYPTPPNGGGLYLIQLSDSHYYGGRTRCFRTRWRSHLADLLAQRHSNPRLQATFNKYGVFRPEVMRKLPRALQASAEQAWLDVNVGEPHCVNLSPNAHGGNQVEWTPEMRKRHSEIHMGHSHSAETRAKMSATRSASPELVEKARISLRENREKITPEGLVERGKAIGDALRGRTASEEAKASMSTAQRRRRTREGPERAAEIGAKIGDALRGRITINNGARTRCVPPEEAESLLATGEWVRGRKPRSSGTG